MAVLNIFRASCLARSSIAARASYMIRSAVDFLPRIIMMFTNFATRREPYLGSGSTSRLAAPARRMDYAPPALGALAPYLERSEEHTSELQSLAVISYAVFCLKKKK